MSAPAITPVVETEVTEQVRRRRFSAEYKKKIRAEADRCKESGEVGELLRRRALFVAADGLAQGGARARRTARAGPSRARSDGEAAR